jgi:hypothetical protein
VDTSKITEPRAFHVDRDWYEAYWLREPAVRRSRMVTAAVAVSLACFASWVAKFIWARQSLAAIPAELSTCVDGAVVASTRQLLLGETKPRPEG